MATDFFDRQDHARRQTIRLLVMFVLSVVVIILAIYLVVAVAAGGMESRAAAPVALLARTTPEQPEGPLAADPLESPAFPGVTLGTIAVIALGQPVQDRRAFLRRRVHRLDAGRPGRQPADHRPGRTAAVERGRGDGAWPPAFPCRRSTCSTTSRGSTPLPPATSRATPWWPSPPAACNTSPARNCRA